MRLLLAAFGVVFGCLWQYLALQQWSNAYGRMDQTEVLLSLIHMTLCGYAAAQFGDKP